MPSPGSGSNQTGSIHAATMTKPWSGVSPSPGVGSYMPFGTAVLHAASANEQQRSREAEGQRSGRRGGWAAALLEPAPPGLLPAAAAAGCAGAGFYNLRRLNATSLVVEGIDVKTAQTRLGHADPRTTLAVYAVYAVNRSGRSRRHWRALLRPGVE